MHDVHLALADPLRLRVLNLLQISPLCVQHLQIVLGMPQVTVSKALLMLKEHGLVESRHIRNWRLYRIAGSPEPALKLQLECLRACFAELNPFPDDLRRLENILSQMSAFTEPKKEKRKPAPQPRPAAPVFVAESISITQEHLL